MSCQDCDSSLSTFTFTPDGEAAIVIGPFAIEGDAVSFGEVADERDVKYDSAGNFLIAGSKLKKSEVTMRVPCSDTAIDMWNQWKRNLVNFCGSANYLDNCCASETWNSARIVSMKRPNSGDSVDYFEIVMEGIYVAS